MKNYKNILKILYKFGLSLLVYLLVITLLAHINFLGYKIVSVLSLIYMCVMFLLSGIRAGKISDKKGYLSGGVIGGILIILMTILALIFRSKLSLSSLLYFLILLICSILGGMIGINKKN